jgi:hypothetical protein
VPADFASRACGVVLFAVVLVSPDLGHAELVLSQGTNFAVDVSPIDGRLAIDLLGNIWTLPREGGQAKVLGDNLLPARRPRWSPDGSRLLYQTRNAGTSQIWAIDPGGRNSTRLSVGDHFDRDPAWHPDGERIVFASARGTSGFDIWETDLPTGLSWRISSNVGDETEPAWSADGRSLAYIQQTRDKWSLMLRRRGQPARVLVESDEPLYAPSWRPDGSLITFLRQRDGDLDIEMAILSEPPLIRLLVAGEDFFVSPVSWRDRDRFFYTSDGLIKSRDFDDWESVPVRFSAAVGDTESRPRTVAREKELPLESVPESRIVIRAARLFDGRGRDYRQDVDVLVDGPRIATVTTRREWSDATVLNLGNVTVLPGLIDSYSSIAARDQAQHGAELLSYGVTTLITSNHRPDYDPLSWETEETPGPRLLWAGDIARNKLDENAQFQFVTIPSTGLGNVDRRSAVLQWQAIGIPVLAESWSIGIGVGADLLLSTDSLPTSPQGYHYQDIRAASSAAPVALVSGLADAGTPGLSALYQSRQAKLLHGKVSVSRRFSSIPNLANAAATIMLGSKPNGLPPGLGLHAEMRALAAAGLSGDQVLRAASRNPANILGLDDQIGVIAEGALADLIVVSGDPLARIADTLNIMAVVRNGRFYSLVSLLERASGTSHVE